MLDAEAFDAGRVRLWNELVNLHDTWDEYRLLFADSAERIEMLNACAGWFFGRTQRLLLRDVILGVSRLTDRGTSHGRKNLVIDFLLEDPALVEDAATYAELKAAVAGAKEAAKPFKLHRHRYIAHLDHEMAVAEDAAVLPGLSRDYITSAITQLETCYNLHGSRIRDSTAFFDLNPLGGAAALVRILEDSKRWSLMQRIREERARAGGDAGGAA